LTGGTVEGIASWISTINLEPGVIPSGIVQANKPPSAPDDTLITCPGVMPSGTITIMRKK